MSSIVYRVTLTSQVHMKSELHLEKIAEEWFNTEGEAFDYALDHTFNEVGKSVRAHIERLPSYNWKPVKKAS